jgi:hypothetical protein
MAKLAALASSALAQWIVSTSLRLMNRDIRVVNTHETIAEVHVSFAVLFTPLFSGRA